MNKENSSEVKGKDGNGKASKLQKPRNLFLDGVSYIADDSLMERLQANLDKVFPNAFNVTEVSITEK